MTDTTILDLNVAMNRQGVIGRRGFLRSVGLGAMGLATVSFTDLMALQADELRKRQMACILLWMGGGPSQLDTFDPKPGTANGGDVKAIDTSVSGIQIAHHWPKTAKMMKEIALIRSMSNKEGNHERATYQLHTGYVPSGTVKHPAFGCCVASELGDPEVHDEDLHSYCQRRRRRQHRRALGMLGAAYEPFLVPEPRAAPRRTSPPHGADGPIHPPARPLAVARSLGLRSRPAAWTASASTTAPTSRRPAWSSRPG